MNRIEVLVGSDWIKNSARSRLPRDALVAALILGSLALFAFPVYPFPPGYDSTTDPRVAGFPLSIQRSDKSGLMDFDISALLDCFD